VRLSVVYKQFFAGELEVAASLPDYWRKVTVLYSGGDDFAICGAWDALIPLAREIQRLFTRFTDATMKDYPGPEAKSLTMALALNESGETLAEVYAEAGRRLELAKASGKNCFYLFGRTLEWKQLNEAEDLKDRMAKIVTQFRCSPQYLNELAGFYKEPAAIEGLASSRARRREKRFDRPWRFYLRLNRVLEAPASREFERQWTHLTGELIGRGTAQRKLRPSGRVALEWVTLSTGL
jgi:CRISPR-associated protein Csm1